MINEKLLLQIINKGLADNSYKLTKEQFKIEKEKYIKNRMREVSNFIVEGL